VSGPPKATTGGGPIRIWNLATGKQEKQFEGHEYGNWRATFTPNGKNVLSVGQDQMVRIWDANDTTEVGRLRHKQIPAGIAATADGKRALSGGWDSAVRLWDLQTRKELCSFDGHPGIQSVALSLDDQYAASAGSDGMVRLWRLPPAVKTRE
jgi:WD40 repeat protein